MKNQQKTSNFMKVATGRFKDPFEIDDFQLQNYEFSKVPKIPIIRKEFNMVNFLNKFDSHSIEIIQKYIVQHKYLLTLPPKPKMTLFQDALIISQFVKMKENIIYDRINTVEALCQKLQGIIKRSKITIKDRICKKLCHAPLEEIMQAFEAKRDINFDKKDKSKKNVAVQQPHHKIQPIFRNFIPPAIKHEDDNGSNSFSNTIPQVQKDQNTTVIQQPVCSRIYKYGTRQLNERIYIYANSLTNQIIQFPPSKLNQMKNRCANFNEPQQKKEPQFNSPIHKLNKYSHHEPQDDIASQLSHQHYKDDKQKNHKLSRIKMDPQQDNIQRVLTNETLRQSLQKQALFKLNNNRNYLEMLKENKDRTVEYLWSQQQDNILYNYKFNPKQYSEDIICLMRYKSKDMILERMKFLSIQLRDNEKTNFNNLGNQNEIIVPKEEQDDWDIQ